MSTNADHDGQPRSALPAILPRSSLPPKKLILSAINLKVANFRHFSPGKTFGSAWPGCSCVILLHIKELDIATLKRGTKGLSGSSACYVFCDCYVCRDVATHSRKMLRVEPLFKCDAKSCNWLRDHLEKSAPSLAKYWEKCLL